MTELNEVRLRGGEEDLLRVRRHYNCFPTLYITVNLPASGLACARFAQRKVVAYLNAEMDLIGFSILQTMEKPTQ